MRPQFYDNLIPSGTKIYEMKQPIIDVFYDNLIPSGTKINEVSFQTFI